MPLHPAIKRIIQRAYYHGHGELPLKSVGEVRQYYQKQFMPKKDVSYQEIKMIGGALIRLHYPTLTQKKVFPVVIYLRASAYVLGSIEDTDYFCHYLAEHLQCIVVAVEPRLSPEVKFPVPFDDCIASIRYLYDNDATLKIDLKKIAIWGESSGGNFAAALCHYFSHTEKDFIKCQVLFYPMLDYYCDYPSKVSFGDGYLMDTTLSDWFIAQYLSHPHDVQDIRVSPLLADKFENLPPTVVIGAQYDPMHDEAVSYVNKLLKNNVSIQTLFLPGMIHGFLGYAMKLAAPQHAQYYAASVVNDYFK